MMQCCNVIMLPLKRGLEQVNGKDINFPIHIAINNIYCEVKKSDTDTQSGRTSREWIGTPNPMIN